MPPCGILFMAIQFYSIGCIYKNKELMVFSGYRHIYNFCDPVYKTCKFQLPCNITEDYLLNTVKPHFITRYHTVSCYHTIIMLSYNYLY